MKGLGVNNMTTRLEIGSLYKAGNNWIPKHKHMVFLVLDIPGNRKPVKILELTENRIIEDYYMSFFANAVKLA
jgi:hypothetical protein